MTNIPSDMATGRWLTRRAGLEARPYYAQTTDDRPDKGWRDDEVHVFHGDAEIGCYSRPYGHLGAQTFEPFERDGKWYALYSADYTCTRVMTLPGCRDIGGEQSGSGGFCPAEIYVPRYRRVASPGLGDGQGYWLFESEAEDHVSTPAMPHEIGPWQSLDIGFVHGCFWASPYEVQVFDLKRAAEGVIPRDDRFPGIALANLGLSIASLIRLACYPPKPLQVTFTTELTRDIAL